MHFQSVITWISQTGWMTKLAAAFSNEPLSDFENELFLLLYPTINQNH